MNAVMSRVLDAPYQYVVVEQPVSDVARLLVVEAQEGLVVSEWYWRIRPCHRRSILELEGMGAELWEDVDAKQYIEELRNEWDHS